MKKFSIDRYTGHRHNRYDGYQSSRGILAGCGGTATADCFADDSDQPDENFDAIFEGKKPINWRAILNNLDITELELAALKPTAENPETETTEYWGNSEISIKFELQGNGDIFVKFADQVGIAVF
jgi:hypothetical protein